MHLRPCSGQFFCQIVDSPCTLRIVVPWLWPCCQNIPHVTLSHRPVGNYHIFRISPSKPRDSIVSFAYIPRNRCGYSVICCRPCKVPDLLRSIPSIPRCGVLVRATGNHGCCQPYNWDVSLTGQGIRTSWHGTSLRLPSHMAFVVSLNCYCHRVTTQLQLVVVVETVIIIIIIIIIPKIREKHTTRKARSQWTTENSHIGHCTHTSESTNVKVQ